MTNTDQPRTIPISERKRLARHARIMAAYTQGTMALEGQAVGRAAFRELVKLAYRNALERARSSAA